jgi:CDP-diacylglycerol--glycerol-3-phosphate 3-phosphatidyltransferase/cardiolipin synthase
MLERLSSSFVVQDWSVRDLKRVPNLLSLSRVLLGGLFPFTLGNASFSVGVLAAAGATDILDGWWARRTRQTTAIGAVVDALADKLFILGVVLALLASGRVSVETMILLGTRDLGELALALRLLMAHRPVFGRSANVGGKIATGFQYMAIVAVLFDSSRAPILVGLAAIAGVTATVAYWRRDVPV